MTDWSDSGYDRSMADRWLYAFRSDQFKLVKVGLVLRESRLRPRLSEVKKASDMPDLEMVWSRCLPSISHEEAEHVEAAVRLWLARSGSLRFIGKVDWLAIDNESDRLRDVLDLAFEAAAAFGTENSPIGTADL